MDKVNKQFLKKLHLKEKTAWEKLYEMYYPSLCNYIFRIIKDDQDAADLTQKIFIKLWEKTIDFKDIRSLTAYLYRSARNSSINYLKHQKIENKRLKSFTLDTDPGNGLDESMVMMIEEEMIRELYNGIEELPKQQREIIKLSAKGLTIKQVAEKLELSINTIKTQKKRAYVALRSKLKNSIFLILLLFLYS